MAGFVRNFAKSAVYIWYFSITAQISIPGYLVFTYNWSDVVPATLIKLCCAKTLDQNLKNYHFSFLKNKVPIPKLRLLTKFKQKQPSF